MTNKLKRLSVTISLTTEKGYNSREVINDQKQPTTNLLKALEQLAYLTATNNVPKEQVKKALLNGFDKANSLYLIDEDIPF